MKRIAIQGLMGSFHDIAAHLYFEGEQITAYHSLYLLPAR